MSTVKHTTFILTLGTFIMIMGWVMEGGLVFAGDPEPDRSSLRGLQGIYVLVEGIGPDAKRDGLTTDQIQTDVELRLRKAGVKVLSAEESFKTPGAPFLSVQVHPMKLSGLEQYAYSYYIELDQDVVLDRDKSIKLVGRTWGSSGVGTVGASGLSSAIRGNLGDHVDEFINAYLAVNPKR